MIRFVIILIISALLSVPAFGQAERTLQIVGTDAQAHTFGIEVVNTAELIERGLSDRDALDASNGILCDFEEAQDASLSMEYTPLPLDMLFINDAGRVIAIAHNTVPQSKRKISTGTPVRAVLKIAAGVSRNLNIEPGAMVRHSLFGNEITAPAEAE